MKEEVSYAIATGTVVADVNIRTANRDRQMTEYYCVLNVSLSTLRGAGVVDRVFPSDNRL